TLYNFKSTMNHGTDYIYYGYNDNETPVDYTKTLSICNVGTANISGTTFSIKVAPEHASLVRAFSHDYDGSSVGFAAGSCENYNVDFEFYRPTDDVEVRFNITVNDNFNSLVWEDYTTFRLSKHPPINLYFASNTQPLEGYLVAPGNQLVRVQFSEFSHVDNFVRVPSFRDNEYSVVLSTSSIDGEDTYMISTMASFDRSKMDGFSDVTAYEPNDDASNATIVPFSYGEVISYLHSGDLDFFTITDAPMVMNQVGDIYSGEDIIVPFNTSLDPQSIINSMTVTQNGAAISGSTSYQQSRNAIVFNPDSSINPGTINITLNGTIKSESGVTIDGDSIWVADVSPYPQTMTAVSSIPATGFIGLLQDYLIAYRVRETGSGTYPAIYDHINKQSPSLVGESVISHQFTAIDGYCYTNESDSSLGLNRPTIYDCRDARNIRKLFTYPISNNNESTSGFTVSGNRLYAVYGFSGNYGLDIFDITDPLNPFLLGSISSTEAGTSEKWGSDITVRNDRLYLNWTWRLHVFDISNESSPTLLQEIYNPSYFHVLESSPDGNTLYTANYSTGKLTTVDIINPGAPVYNETLPAMPSGVKYLSVSGMRLYVLTDQHVMQAIDITAPSGPTVLGSYRYSTSPSISNLDRVTIQGNFAYIFDYYDREVELINIQMYQ
ncbi:MAG: hypothetical protein JSW45_04575, partial [Thiotrichales bacterium]